MLGCGYDAEIGGKEATGERGRAWRHGSVILTERSDCGGSDARIREGCGSGSRGGLERAVFGMPIFGEGLLARGRRARR